MNMVRHNFKGKNVNPYFFGFILNNLYESVFDFTNKHRTPSFGTPYQMIIYKIYMMFAMFIFHVDNISHINKSVKRKIKKEQPFIPRINSGAFWLNIPVMADLLEGK